MQAARAAAMLQRDLGVDAVIEPAPYGTLQVLVGDEVVVDSGPLAFMGVVPSLSEIRDRVAERLTRQ